MAALPVLHAMDLPLKHGGWQISRYADFTTMKKSYHFIDSEFFARSLHGSTLPSPYFKAMLTYPGWESTYPIFRYFQGREPITLLGNLFQCLKTPDILGTRPFLLHLKLIFSWSVSALSGH